jgi:CubicO group peptidase (beta-lactamase class C family)
MRRRLLTAAALLLVASDARAQTQTAAIDSFVTAEMQRQRIPGVGIAVIRNGSVVLAKGYGYANLEHMVPASDVTIFQSGSLGKMFTAAGVMLLVEDGKLALSDPITKFFPDAPAAWRPITVRHLLTHTSGIPDYTTDAFDYRKDYTEDELAKFAYAETLEFPAGSRWNYSNTGYALLGFIIRRASGRFYGDLLQERVFKPLGMTQTRVISEADIVPHRSDGYVLVRGEIKNQEWVAPQLNTTADGALYFSIRDLIEWEMAVRRRTLLKPESWREILTPVRLNSGRTYPYGFGWSVDQRNGMPFHAHGGAWQGFKTQLSRFIGDDLTVIALANLGQADPSRFTDGIAALMNPALAVKPLAPITDREPETLKKLYRVLDLTREGKLTPADFAYVRAGFFPGTARAYETLLQRIGSPSRAVLVDRTELGDDRIYTYELTIGQRTYLARLGLAPDDRVSVFSLREKR